MFRWGQIKGKASSSVFSDEEEDIRQPLIATHWSLLSCSLHWKRANQHSESQLNAYRNCVHGWNLLLLICLFYLTLINLFCCFNLLYIEFIFSACTLTTTHSQWARRACLPTSNITSAAINFTKQHLRFFHPLQAKFTFLAKLSGNHVIPNPHTPKQKCKN